MLYLVRVCFYKVSVVFQVRLKSVFMNKSIEKFNSIVSLHVSSGVFTELVRIFRPHIENRIKNAIIFIGIAQISVQSPPFRMV